MYTELLTGPNTEAADCALLFSGQSAQTTPASPQHTLDSAANSSREIHTTAPHPAPAPSPQSSDHHHMAPAPCPMKRATIITPQKKPWLEPSCFSSSCSSILFFAKQQLPVCPWEELWLTLSSDSSPSGSSLPLSGQGAQTVSQEKPSSQANSSSSLSLCLSPALIRQCPQCMVEKSQPTLNQIPFSHQLSLGTHRVI